MLFRDLKIPTKYPIVIVALALLAAITTGIVANTHSDRGMRAAAASKLLALLESRKGTLDIYFTMISEDLRILASSPLVIDALRKFKGTWNDQGEIPKDRLQRLYITNNPHPIGKKEKLDAANDGSDYSMTHEKYHPIFRRILHERGYHDIFLFDNDGNLVYTVTKELDYATNMMSGQWKDTDLAKAFRTARDNPEPGFLAFFDFRSYEPSYGKPASFISTPVFDEKSVFIGVLAYQMPSGRLNAIMNVTAGMGETGETYVVGKDLLMRSDSRFSESSTILKTHVDTVTVHKALNGETGVEVSLDYRGVTVMSAYAPQDFLGVRWAIMAEVDESEILAPVFKTRDAMVISVAVIAVLITIIGYFLAMSLSRPLVNMTKAMVKLARREIKVKIPSLHWRDELGDMASAMQVFQENDVKRIQDEKNLLLSEETLKYQVVELRDREDRLEAQAVEMAALSEGLKEAKEKMEHLANHDALTGLPSLRLCNDRLESALTIGRRKNCQTAVLFIDLDGFKAVNDSMGHEAGDQVLKGVAERLKSSIREVDTAARIGGDEFLVVLPETGDKYGIAKVAKKIIGKISEPFIIDDTQARIGASIGIAISPADGTNADELLRCADESMYIIKKRGKNNYGFYS
ncbi:diguanylate cyclase domain-containing protein [Colwellia piezophila]|uniref:diguanylate cyclase domain-containing protein n=1 Tax=Colwellia piezophila TaxID=211668 RepID=UPI000377639C|nr:diguanylate cyclase [Colwellia piezophila]